MTQLVVVPVKLKGRKLLVGPSSPLGSVLCDAVRRLRQVSNRFKLYNRNVVLEIRMGALRHPDNMYYKYSF